MTASTRISRLLALVPYLMNRSEAPMEQVAGEFGISPGQLRKDLELLSWCGLPGLEYGSYIEIDLDAVDGTGVIRLSNADYLTRPLRFTADEAVALLLALRSLREMADPDQIAVIDAAAAKLEHAAGEGAAAADRAELRISGGDETVRRAVHRALREQRRLDLTYDVAARAETTHRQVDPLRASMRDGYAYLDAWCHRAGGLRSFRMDRIAEATVTDLPVDPHPDVDLPDAAQGWFADGGGEVVTLDLRRGAHWVVEYYPTVAGDQAQDDAFPGPDGTGPDGTGPDGAGPDGAGPDGTGPDGTGPDRAGAGLRRARFRVGDPAWLRGLLLRLGSDAVVVDPPDAAGPALREARDTIAQYRALGLLDTAPGAGG